MQGLQKSLFSVQYPPDKAEIIIVDDGSYIPILAEDLKAIKLPVRIIRHPQNQGITKALNTGLNEIRNRSDYKYIARLDAGDTCHPERFIKQVNFLDSHPEIFLLGSWCRFENSVTKRGFDYLTKTSHRDIIKEMHLKCSFIHPTVIFRREVPELIGNYPLDFPHAEDYAFFWKIIKIRKSAVLSEKLVIINLSENTVSGKNYKKQIKSRKKIITQFGTIRGYISLGIFQLTFKLLLPKWAINQIKTEKTIYSSYTLSLM